MTGPAQSRPGEALRHHLRLCGQQQPQLMTFDALNFDLAAPAGPHDLSESESVIRVRLVHLHRQCGLRISRTQRLPFESAYGMKRSAMEVRSCTPSLRSRLEHLTLSITCMLALLFLSTLPLGWINRFEVEFQSTESSYLTDLPSDLAVSNTRLPDPHLGQEIVTASPAAPISRATAVNSGSRAATTEISLIRLLSRLKRGFHTSSDLVPLD
jgi:hypothetical protein